MPAVQVPERCVAFSKPPCAASLRALLRSNLTKHGGQSAFQSAKCLLSFAGLDASLDAGLHVALEQLDERLRRRRAYCCELRHQVITGLPRAEHLPDSACVAFDPSQTRLKVFARFLREVRGRR